MPSEMRLFLKHLSRFGAIQAFLALSLGGIYYSPAVLGEHYLAASRDKQRLLHQQRPPRLVLTGGSSMAYGINSEILRRECGLNPVNMGLNAALGLSFMLEELKAGLQPGDVVILAPEYQLYDSPLGQCTVLAMVLNVDPANLRFIDPSQYRSLLDQGLTFQAGVITRGSIKHLERMLRPERRARLRTMRRSGFNEYGDLVSHYGKENDLFSTDDFRYQFRAETLRASIDALNRFHAYCQRRGIQTWLSYPPLPIPTYQLNAEALRQLDAFLRQTVTIPLLQSPGEVVYPLEVFYDSLYHLNQEGQARRSTDLARRLQAVQPTPPRGHP